MHDTQTHTHTQAHTHARTHTGTHTLPRRPYLCLSAVSLGVSLEALGVDADGGAGPDPSPAAAQPEHQAGAVGEHNPQSLRVEVKGQDSISTSISFNLPKLYLSDGICLN